MTQHAAAATTADTFWAKLPAPFVEPTPRRIRVRLGNELVADSSRAQLLVQYGPAGLPTYYLRIEDVTPGVLADETTGPDGQQTWAVSAGGKRVEAAAYTQRHDCPDGRPRARYWSLRVGDAFLPDVAWSYPDPIPENPKIRDLLAFFNERVDLVVDGKTLERPVSPWSNAKSEADADAVQLLGPHPPSNRRGTPS